MWLFCRIFNNGKSSCLNRRKHNVDGCADRHDIHINRCADKFFCLCTHNAVNNINLCAEHLETLYMLVDRSYTKITATRKRNICLAESAKHCTNQVVACSEMRCKFIWYTLIINICSVNIQGVFVDNLNLCTHSVENFDNQMNIADLRDIFYSDSIFCQKSRRDNSDCSIFSTADINFSEQFVSTVNNKIIHDFPSVHKVIKNI